MNEDLVYYEGYKDGLNEGMKALRYLLESARTLDDVLNEYNELAVKNHEVFTKIHLLKQEPELV